MTDICYKDAFAELVIMIFAAAKGTFTEDEIDAFVLDKNNRQLTDDCIRLVVELGKKAGVDYE